jgi:hypothetical protein
VTKGWLNCRWQEDMAAISAVTEVMHKAKRCILQMSILKLHFMIFLSGILMVTVITKTTRM